MSTAAMKKYPISALPLPTTTQILTHALTPDKRAPSVTAFKEIQKNERKTEDGERVGPSIQRRARLLDATSHFSYVAPFPVGFPYEIRPPEDGEEQVEDKAGYVEKWLAERESVHAVEGSSENGLRIHYPKNRDQPRELVGFSETGLRDCLPHLDVGDAFEIMGAPSLSGGSDEIHEGSSEAKAARQELVDILSGHAMLMSGDDAQVAFAPWSLRYSGHQFGSWAGQLGDGRAISILVTPHPSSPNTPNLSYELQLKGAGRTPFSRSADGLAVLRSSIREFLCAEAMHALGVPTTRSLSIVSFPELSVYRERVETASVVCRLAPSFIRIGSFQGLNPPQGMFFFGGGQQNADYDALRILGEWVAKRVLFLEVGEGEAWGGKLLMEVARRNARMVAGWQAYGFMHGVINTDNVSVLGLTIDYGPYAFMDVFDPLHICNHSDDGGRYNYQNQPSMILYALRALHAALAPLIGAEAELGGAVAAGWASSASAEQIDAWKKRGTEAFDDDLQRVFQQTCADEYGRLMRARLGLRRREESDEAELVRPLLQLMQEHALDFHAVFRKLASFRSAMLGEDEALHADEGKAATNAAEGQSALERFLSAVLSQTPEPERLDRARAAREWMAWLEKYGARIEGEREMWLEGEREREEAMRRANPRFVLRQWVLEEVIKKCEEDVKSGRRVLRKVLKMACEPFEKWGGEDEPEDACLADKEVMEERRYCGMGERKMLGFQCSCSS